MYQHVSALPFERTGRLVSHSGTDRLGRPDAIEFQGRSGTPLIDWVADATVWLDRWPTRAGVATILEQAEVLWVPCASAMPFDGLYVRNEQEVKVTFSSYVPLGPGATYRLHFPGAVLTRNTVRIGALQCEPQRNTRRAPRKLRPPSTPAAPRRAS